jgi:TonB family protein
MPFVFSSDSAAKRGLSEVPVGTPAGVVEVPVRDVVGRKALSRSGAASPPVVSAERHVYPAGLTEVPVNPAAMNSAAGTVHSTAVGMGEPTVTMKPGSVPSRLSGSEYVTRKPFGADTIPAEPKEGNIPPAYPNQLRAAHIEGEVVARFLVASNGRVEPATFELVRSDHELFTAAVRTAIGSYRFTPARINGNAVDWTLTMPFVFSLSK